MKTNMRIVIEIDDTDYSKVQSIIEIFTRLLDMTVHQYSLLQHETE